MSVLRELDPSAVHVPRWRATAFEEAIDSIRESRGSYIREQRCFHPGYLSRQDLDRTDGCV